MPRNSPLEDRRIFRILASTRCGLTLIELVVVMVILAVLAGIVIPLAGGFAESGQQTATTQTLSRLRGATMGDGAQAGYFVDLGIFPQAVADLLRFPNYLPAELLAFDAIAKRGWRGPYLLGGSLDSNLNPAIVDAWGTPIIIHAPIPTDGTSPSLYVRFVSAGPNGIVDTPATQGYPPRSSCVDDLVLYIAGADFRQ